MDHSYGFLGWSILEGGGFERGEGGIFVLRVRALQMSGDYKEVCVLFAVCRFFGYGIYVRALYFFICVTFQAGAGLSRLSRDG